MHTSDEQKSVLIFMNVTDQEKIEINSYYTSKKYSIRDSSNNVHIGALQLIPLKQRCPTLLFLSVPKLCTQISC